MPSQRDEVSPTDSVPALTWVRRALWLVNTAAIVLPLLLFLLAKYEIEPGNRSGILFIYLDGIQMYIVLVVAFVLMLALNLGGSFWIRKRSWNGSWVISIIGLILVIVAASGYYCFSFSNQGEIIMQVTLCCIVATLITNSWAIKDFNQGFKGWARGVYLYFGILVGIYLLAFAISYIQCNLEGRFFCGS